jgi:hypothetical protein
MTNDPISALIKRVSRGGCGCRLVGCPGPGRRFARERAGRWSQVIPKTIGDWHDDRPGGP